MKEIALTLEELLKLRQDLNEASDELSKRILAHELDLQKLGLGVQVWTQIPGSEHTHIGYIKYNGQWKICARYPDAAHGNWKDNKDVQQVIPKIIKPLTECERGLRLSMYKHIGLLMPALEKAAAKLLSRLNKVLHDIDDKTVEDKEESLMNPEFWK